MVQCEVEKSVTVVLGTGGSKSLLIHHVHYTWTPVMVQCEVDIRNWEEVGAKKVLWEQLGWGGAWLLRFSGYFTLYTTTGLNIAIMQILSRVRNFINSQVSNWLGKQLALGDYQLGVLASNIEAKFEEKNVTSIRFPCMGWKDCFSGNFILTVTLDPTAFKSPFWQRPRAANCLGHSGIVNCFQYWISDSALSM